MRLFWETSFTAPSASSALAAIVPFDITAGSALPALAHRWPGNLLALTPETMGQLDSERLIVNSGSLAEDLDTLDPRNWMASGEAALIAQLDALDPALRASEKTLLIEPHSRHILNDAQVVHNFFRERIDEQIGLALNPTALFEPSMLALAADHLTRIIEALAPLANMLILTNAKPDATSERLAPCDLNAGVHDLGLILDACLPLLAPDTPIVLRQAGTAAPSGPLVESILARVAARPGV